MDIIIRGSKLEVTDAMESYAKEKLERLNKYLEDVDNIKATVVAKVHGHLNTVEVTIPLKNFILRAEEVQDDYYAAIDTVIDRNKRFCFWLYRRNRRYTCRKNSKEKKIEVKPRDEEEAILQMELLGHEFYLFKDADTNKPMLVYKRKDGNYGVIEAE